jgi:hypothetical protein
MADPVIENPTTQREIRDRDTREVEACANYDLCDNSSMLYGALINTKQQAINEIGAINGTIVFNTFFFVEMSKQIQMVKSMLAL